MIKSFSRGHEIYYKDGGWYYSDTDEKFEDNRPCKRCGNHPTKEGYDYCLGKIEEATSACCGHGVEEKILIY